MGREGGNIDVAVISLVKNGFNNRENGENI
jgi:hypothetical protein